MNGSRERVVIAAPLLQVWYEACLAQTTKGQRLWTTQSTFAALATSSQRTGIDPLMRAGVAAAYNLALVPHTR